jgi:hypothetical protein
MRPLLLGREASKRGLRGVLLVVLMAACVMASEAYDELYPGATASDWGPGGHMMTAFFMLAERGS